MTSPVLIVAASDDWPTDRVVIELQHRGVEVFRMDTVDFPQRLALAGRIDQECAWTGELTTEHRTVELSRVGAVYYRAPGAFQFPQGMSGPEERFAAAQAGGPVIYKPVASPVLIEEGQLKSVYAHCLTLADLEDLQGISTTAHLFQSWVDKDHEVRLTVVGEHMFAAAIHAGSDAAHEDWRSDYGALTYTITTVPEQVAEGMRRLMDRLQLRYGAADFIVGPQGRWTFLEVNPCGQWDWIQGETGLPIAQAIADDLQGVS
ncbi:MvdC/MvdD family ATP grasp protein [Streptomyces sp. NPDC058424]|uniref:MvdC/MvdD family ATP grasp protein n=1 Tax=Streptomyces sp. NPDC058424 TaxID=3346491 RepID=UPI0036476545